MKISKKVREEAALICAIAASNDMSIEFAARGLGLEFGQSRELALRAYFSDSVPVRSPNCSTYADAEALIRIGWSP